MSCGPCRRFAEALKSGQYVPWSRSWHNIQVARNGCALCRLVYNAYETDATHTELVRTQILGEPWRSCTINSGRLPTDNEMVHVEPLSPRNTELAEHVIESLGGAAQECAMWLSIGPSSGSPSGHTSDQIKRLMLQPVATGGNSNTALFEGRLISSPCIDIQVIWRWLKRCDEYHPSCRRSLEDDMSDLILIDVYSRTARPVTEKSVPYTALSYCCGDGDLGSIGIDGTLPTTIPRTIEDAIFVTQCLGFRYIWVDCYCIPQNDEALRRIALGNMWKIYRGSSLTIVAPYGTADTGLPGIRTGLRLVNDFVGGFNGRMWMPVPVDDAYEQAWNFWRMRAWTYQEAALSRRSLFFGLTKMYFACQTEGFVEFLAEPWTVDPISGERRISPMRYNHGLVEYELPPLGRTSHLSFHTYRRLLLEYTRRNITYLSDRLDAILGIMNALSASGSARFHFGLLESDFIRSFLWIPLKMTGRSYARYTDNCHFPSWSWAGSEGPSQALGTNWQFIGTHISKITRTGEVIQICNNMDSDVQRTPVVPIESSQAGTRPIQNDSLWLYEPLIIVETFVADALLDLTAEVTLYNWSGHIIPHRRFTSWPRMPAAPAQSIRPILLLAIATAGNEVAVVCLENQGVAAYIYIALGWTTLISGIWTQLAYRYEEVRIY